VDVLQKLLSYSKIANTMKYMHVDDSMKLDALDEAA
jgi:hypothetical protein